MVRMFGTAGCMPCRATKKRLDSLGIEYSYVDINKDADALAEVHAMGYQQVPVIVAGDSHFGGFQPDRIAALA